jgi:hypothetical protein
MGSRDHSRAEVHCDGGRSISRLMAAGDRVTGPAGGVTRLSSPAWTFPPGSGARRDEPASGRLWRPHRAQYASTSATRRQPLRGRRRERAYPGSALNTHHPTLGGSVAWHCGPRRRCRVGLPVNDVYSARIVRRERQTHQPSTLKLSRPSSLRATAAHGRATKLRRPVSPTPGVTSVLRASSRSLGRPNHRLPSDPRRQSRQQRS